MDKTRFSYLEIGDQIKTVDKKEILLKQKKLLESQLNKINGQINNLAYETVAKEKTMTIETGVRDNIKVWGAIITSLDPKYSFKREFKSYRHMNSCSSKHAYYDYFIDVEEGQFVETSESSQYKNKRYYYHLVNGEFISVDPKDIILYFQELKNVEKIS
jgi:hypothetical protein